MIEKFYNNYGEYLGEGILLRYGDLNIYNSEVETIIKKITDNYFIYDNEVIEKIIKLLDNFLHKKISINFNIMEVICVDDSNQPIGGELVKGNKYLVDKDYINLYDQRTFIIKGINNEGTTKMGVIWKGYKSERFEIINNKSELQKEEAFHYAFN